MNRYRNTLEKFAESRDFDLSRIIDTRNPAGKFWLVNYDLHYRHPISLDLYREIVQTLENNGESAWDNIDLENWEIF